MKPRQKKTWEERGDGVVRWHLRVKPGAKVSQVFEASETLTVLKLAAPPVEGAANRELVRFLAELLGIPRSRIQLVKGDKAAYKSLDINGLTLAEIKEKIGLL